VVVAVPVTAAPRVLETLAPHLARVPLVTDAGSTKRGVVAAAERLGLGTHFVGAHPMAGDHRAGWAASRRGLFEGALVYLCPTAQTRGAALAHARALWTLLGADPARLETIDAAAHDRRVAWTSHLPQLAASALARALAERDIPRRELGPGGRDTTRLAGSDPAMWAAIARDNADEISRAVAELERTLAELRAAVDARDEARVRGLLAAARTWAEGR
jgi:prephenate dehydrogenase